MSEVPHRLRVIVGPHLLGSDPRHGARAIATALAERGFDPAHGFALFDEHPSDTGRTIYDDGDVVIVRQPDQDVEDLEGILSGTAVLVAEWETLNALIGANVMSRVFGGRWPACVALTDSEQKPGSVNAHRADQHGTRWLPLDTDLLGIANAAWSAWRNAIRHADAHVIWCEDDDAEVERRGLPFMQYVTSLEDWPEHSTVMWHFLADADPELIQTAATEIAESAAISTAFLDVFWGTEPSGTTLIAPALQNCASLRRGWMMTSQPEADAGPLGGDWLVADKRLLAEARSYLSRELQPDIASEREALDWEVTFPLVEALTGDAPELPSSSAARGPVKYTFTPLKGSRDQGPWYSLIEEQTDGTSVERCTKATEVRWIPVVVAAGEPEGMSWTRLLELLDAYAGLWGGPGKYRATDEDWRDGLINSLRELFREFNKAGLGIQVESAPQVRVRFDSAISLRIAVGGKRGTPTDLVRLLNKQVDKRKDLQSR